MGDDSDPADGDAREAERARVRRCLGALGRMLAEERLATDGPTTGAEIELVLVDDRMAPAMLNHAVLGRSDSDVLTCELGSWNLEINAPPRSLPEGAESALEHDIRSAVARAEASARTVGARAATVGILPTLGPEHLGRHGLTDDPRYAMLNERALAERGGPFRLDIAEPTAGGPGEHLRLDLDSVAAEAACTSLQLHLQLSPDSFPSYWNAAQSVAGVQVALAANSPFFLAHRLWAETRVPVFTQALDTRTEAQRAQGVPPRVWFGGGWASSAYALFEQNVLHFDTLLADGAPEEDPLVALDEGRTPDLSELCRHNSTIWRWNRPVYDVADGVPHLRLENRVLPAGPTAADGAADAMFFFGLVRTLAEQERPPWRRLPFAAAEANFTAGARHGVAAELVWPDRVGVGVAELVLEELLPMAARGLASWGVGDGVAARHLGVIEQRARARRTGATWQIETAAGFERAGATRHDALRRMFELYLAHAASGEPVHTWSDG